MKIYKKDFIDFLLETEAFKIGKFQLKSGRISPYFINTGMFKDGKTISKLGYFYAAKIMDKFKPQDFDLIFGPAYKGIPLSITTAIALSQNFGVNKGYTFDRKELKKHGEQNWIVGHKIEDKNKILIIDDVFTTGETKYAIIDLLNSIANNLQYVGLIIAVNRQEIGENKISAIKQFEEQTKIQVDSIVTITEIIEYLISKKKIDEEQQQEFKNYLQKYGVGI